MTEVPGKDISNTACRDPFCFVWEHLISFWSPDLLVSKPIEVRKLGEWRTSVKPSWVSMLKAEQRHSNTATSPTGTRNSSHVALEDPAKSTKFTKSSLRFSSCNVKNLISLNRPTILSTTLQHCMPTGNETTWNWISGDASWRKQ